RFPSTPRALRKLTTAELVARATARLRFEGGSVVAMVPVPGLPGRRALGRPFCDDPGKACLAVATRRDSGSRGETTLFDLETLVAVPLAFPGPVRSLSTSDQVAPADESLAELRAKTPAPGSLLFGVLDEEACGSPACGGVAAVDTRGEAGPVGFEVVQSEGFASQPVRWSDGLVSGFTVAAGARVAVLDGGSYEVTPVPLLGSFTASNGELVFFDALEQRLFEQPGATASLGAVRYAPAALPDGGLPGYLSGPAIVGEAARVGEALVATSRATVVDGAFRSQDVEITWRGALTPAGGLPATSATRVALPGALARWVAVGDEVSFDGCDAVGSVSSVTGAQAIVRGAEACGAVRRASLRAAGERPFVVAATLDGLLGRARSGETFRYVGAPAVRLPGVDPTQPLLVVPFGSDTDTSPPLAGARWTLPIDAALSPLVSRVDINAFGATLTSCSATVTLPGALAYDVTRQRLFSVYPSGNVVVEFDPARTVRGPIGPNNGVFCYR
ncbi:MAG: hypothetical protein INH41_16135, partial [Myxococcaceae bacterium]|nr:hypothetical protein [Myxococcaceae bacterium]